MNSARPEGLLGLIFLRFAEVRFAAQRAQLESPSPIGWERGRGEGYSGDPSKELSIHGVEKTDETGRLCRLVALRKDLAVHSLEGEIKHGGNINGYYGDPFDACRAEPSPVASRHPLPVGEGRGEGHENERHGRFDFVLANPPFNVNAVDKERLKDIVGSGRRFPFGLPRTDNATAMRASAKTESVKPDCGNAGETELDPPLNVNAMDAANCEVRSPKRENRSVRLSKFDIRHSPASGLNSSTPRSMKREEPDSSWPTAREPGILRP